MTPLEPLERLGFLDGADHEPMALQHPVDGDPTHPDTPPPEDGVDPKSTPRGVLSPQLEDSIDEVPVDPVRAVAWTAGLVPVALHAFLSVVSAPVTEPPLGDPEELANLLGPDALLEMVFDGVQSETDVFLGQGHPFRGAASCPNNSGGKMSGYTTAK